MRLKMKKVLLFLLVWLLPIGLFAQQGNNNQQKTLVFTHVAVIDATGAPAKPDMTVVVKGDRIDALGKTSKLAVPRNAQVVDATGNFLIPGLWDMHAHVHLGKRYLALFTANGVTGIRVMLGRPKHHEWRKEISAGELIGPRMVIGSPIIDGPNDSDKLIVRNEDEGRQVVRKVKREGADFVKVYHNLPRDVYFAIADEAKKQGLPFAGHIPFSVSAAEASDAGQQSAEHIHHIILMACLSREEQLRKNNMEGQPERGGNPLWETYSEQKAAEFFARFVKNNTWVCPTALIWSEVAWWDGEDLANDPRLRFMPLSTVDQWHSQVDDRTARTPWGDRAVFKRFCRKQLEVVGAMRLAGVGLLAGTDTPVPYCLPGFGLHDELALFVRAGLSPMEALRTATYNPAKFFGKLDSMGTIEKGKIADLVLLEANPLQDISNTQKIAAVVLGGKIYDKTALQKMLAQVKPSRLHEAAARGKIEHVKSLIAEGADVNARDQQGWTPALAALRAGEWAMIDLLVENGADTAAPHLAAYTGDLRGIKRLLEKDTPVDRLEGFTLLHAAAAGGHTDVVEFLIAKGFEATATTTIGENYEITPLHYAAQGNHQEMAKILMANGALVDSGTPTPLIIAAMEGHKDMVEFLISKGADVNAAVKEYGITALHLAGGGGHVNVATLLIDKGADIEAKSIWGTTPLFRAVQNGKLGAAQFLLSKGANVNATTNNGKTPLAVAKERGHTEIVELLGKHGAKE
jgi:ankyrin repeat protein